MLLPLILTSLALSAAPYGFHAEELRGQISTSLASDYLGLPMVTPELRALPPRARPAAVAALGAFVRAYVESDAFKAQYAQTCKDGVPPPPEPVRKYEVLVAAGRAQFKAQRAEQEKALKQLPPDDALALRSGLDDFERKMEESLANKELVVGADEARFGDETRFYEQAKLKYPEDPRVHLRHQLKNFLELTAGVDHAAKLVKCGAKKCFAKAEYEEKPYEWKLAFRAGKEATDAARAFAQGWLKDLK